MQYGGHPGEGDAAPGLPGDCPSPPAPAGCRNCRPGLLCLPPSGELAGQLGVESALAGGLSRLFCTLPCPWATSGGKLLCLLYCVGHHIALHDAWSLCCTWRLVPGLLSMYPSAWPHKHTWPLVPGPVEHVPQCMALYVHLAPGLHLQSHPRAHETIHAGAYCLLAGRIAPVEADLVGWAEGLQGCCMAA